MRTANLAAVVVLVLVAPLVAAVNTAAQDPEAVESGLALDRPTRRLIQQGLTAEGFDPGTPDGLFGPRTRAAIRAWQGSREQAVTGYLDLVQAEALRLAGMPDTGTVRANSQAPRSTTPSLPAPPAPSVPEASPAPVSAAVRCDNWNTEEFFEVASTEEVTACLGNGAGVAVRSDDFGYTPLFMAAWYNENPAVIETLLDAGADIEVRSDDTFTPLLVAAAFNENLAVFDALLAAGADIEARIEVGGGVLNPSLTTLN